jgi:hypothetical protein
MVSITACHAVDPGSIPGIGVSERKFIERKYLLCLVGSPGASIEQCSRLTQLTLSRIMVEIDFVTSRSSRILPCRLCAAHVRKIALLEL